MAEETKRNDKVLVLFDVDGTLTEARKTATAEVLAFLKDLRSRVVIGMVGGSDMDKQKEQLGDDLLGMFDWVFPQNGLVAYKDGTLLATQTFREFLGEEKLKRFINFVLRYLSEVDCPVKRGTFIEYRTGMLNISPIGRACSRPERVAFEEFDKEAGVRKKMVAALEAEFGEELGLKFSIGGQISFDVFPKGWDKTYCLQFVEKEGYEEIHFFGDKTYEGGNDYEIFSSDKTIGHTVTSPADTMRICKELFGAAEGSA